MNVLGAGSCRKLSAVGLSVSEKLKSLSNGEIIRVELSGSCVCIDSISDLVVAALVQTSQVKPDFRNVGVDADSARICIERISELVDLEVEDANRTPKSRVTTIAVHCLLVGLVRLVIFLACHVCTTKKIPTLGIRRIYAINYLTGGIKRRRNHLPASKLLVKYWMASSWFWKLDPSW
jgi:hypothetical protein